MRRRIWLLVAATTSVVMLAFVVPLGVLVETNARNSAVMAATSQSRAVVPLVAAADDAAAGEAARAATRGGFSVLVRLPSGRTVGVPPERWGGGQASTSIRSTTVRTLADGSAVVDQPVFRSDGTAVVSAHVLDTELQRGVVRTRVVLVLLGLALVGLSLLAADRLARSMTRPVSELAAAADRLGHGHLDTSVELEGPPEIREVAQAMNTLSRRIADLLVREREAVADLSHQLRTPLTALRLDTEALRDPCERARLCADVDYLVAGVDAVIAQARRPLREQSAAQPVSDLADVAAERLAFWRVLAEEQSRRVDAELPPGPCLVAAGRDEVAAALDALLDNVFAHTPEGSGFTVAVARERSGGATLTVADEGPGFAHQVVPARGESAAGSTGLGLDIAQRLARSSGGSAHIVTGPAGAQVRLRIGGPPPGAG